MATKKPTKREAVKLVYVSGLFGDYRLRVTSHPSTQAFRDLHYSAFTNFRAAQAIANAIRAHITGPKRPRPSEMNSADQYIHEEKQRARRNARRRTTTPREG